MPVQRGITIKKSNWFIRSKTYNYTYVNLGRYNSKILLLIRWPALIFFLKDLNPITIANINQDPIIMLSISRVVSHSQKFIIILPNRQGIIILIILYN